LPDLAFALLEDNNGEQDCDAHAEDLDAQYDGTQKVIIPRHAGGVRAAHFTAIGGAWHTPAQEGSIIFIVQKLNNSLQLLSRAVFAN
jgi:hypothetical protein